jgi:hypothetical protein
MGSPRSEFDLLLAAPDPVEAEMARGLLRAAGIPSYLHGQDRGFSDLGCAVHRMMSRPDLYVPRGLRARAQELLAEAWDPKALVEEDEEEPSDVKRPREGPGFFTMAVIAIVSPFAALIALALRLFGQRRQTG